jgi:glycosyltransferase involved in cell wall biosynthesis
VKIAVDPTIPQPPKLPSRGNGLTVAIAGLALGGAERIVLDWAIRIHPSWKVRLLVLRDHDQEWPVPPFVEVVRLHGRLGEELRSLGREIAASPHPVCLCHLLKREERALLSLDGAFTVPVLHNAREGWLEEPSSLAEPYALTVSNASAADLHASGWRYPVSVIHHLPAPRAFAPGVRESFRQAWNIPLGATVVGMIGAVKPQKDYPFALRVLQELLARRDAYLVILGGPIGRHGRAAWEAIVREMEHLGLRHRVALPGFLPDATQCLPALDCVLNTSHYEGLSIATLEALVNRVPVVASRVGGQGEVEHRGLTLIAKDAPLETWSEALEAALGTAAESPAWSTFPAYRLWTLAALARPVRKTNRVLFVTANLNAGGAQRSLVNLARALGRKVRFEIAVAGLSTAAYFFQQLARAGVKVFRTGDSRDAFDHAEALIEKICCEEISTVCFWNLDPKIKLLVVKTLQFAEVRFLDVDPGSAADEMRGVAEFQRRICFDPAAYYRRLDRWVLKYRGAYPPECEGKVTCIPNGAPEPGFTKSSYALHAPPRVVVSGRIAPTKFLLEILEAIRIVWTTMPEVELHLFGAAEPRHQEYAEQVVAAAGLEAGKRIFFRGARFDMAAELPEFDAYVVLGAAQGCPNALLEALAAGLPAIANDEGGTREQIRHEETGLLLPDRFPERLGAELLRLLRDRGLAEKIGRRGRQHVRQRFSMREMAQRYARLLKRRPYDEMQEVQRQAEHLEASLRLHPMARSL